MYYIIYVTTNTVNDMYYVGMHKTKNLADGYLGSGKNLLKAVEKFGKDKFIVEILDYAENYSDLKMLEAKYVTEEVLKDPMNYNMVLGGQSTGWTYINSNQGSIVNPRNTGIKKTEDSKNRASIALRKTWEERGHPWQDRKHTAKTKEKLVATLSKIKHQQGEKNSQYGTCWIYNLELKKNKKIPKEMLEDYISDGWLKGRKMKL
jgi:hypothetical protein